MAQRFFIRKVRFSHISLVATFLYSSFSLCCVIAAFAEDSVSLWSHGSQQHALDRRQRGQPFRKERYKR